LLTAGAAVAAGEVWQLADGRAAVYDERLAASSGDRTTFQTSGTYTVTKTTSVVLTDGQPVYWDHSANSATYAPASDRDFFLGACVGDAASADATCQVNINVRPSYKIEMGRNALEDEFLTVVVKTVVGSTTVEVPHLEYWPGAARMVFGATAEAQKVDALSQQGFAVTSNWIVEGGFNVIDDGDATAIDFNIGVANGTHATDADSITESCFLHLDGNTLDLFAESDDGGTEVAATDTTVNIALATPVHFVIDGRNPADVQIYVNGVLMLGSTTFVLTAATGPLKLLAHLEKTSDDTTADYRINYLRVRTAEQD
jgi:predicted RecA/RadA family phage recombinase